MRALFSYIQKDRVVQVMLGCGALSLLLVLINIGVGSSLLFSVAMGFLMIAIVASMIVSRRRRLAFVKKTDEILQAREEKIYTERELREIKRKKGEYNFSMLIRVAILILVLVLILDIV